MSAKATIGMGIGLVGAMAVFFSFYFWGSPFIFAGVLVSPYQQGMAGGMTIGIITAIGYFFAQRKAQRRTRALLEGEPEEEVGETKAWYDEDDDEGEDFDTTELEEMGAGFRAGRLRRKRREKKPLDDLPKDLPPELREVWDAVPLEVQGELRKVYGSAKQMAGETDAQPTKSLAEIEAEQYIPRRDTPRSFSNRRIRRPEDEEEEGLPPERSRRRRRPREDFAEEDEEESSEEKVKPKRKRLARHRKR